jgi:hypothetical protein
MAPKASSARAPKPRTEKLVQVAKSARAPKPRTEKLVQVAKSAAAPKPSTTKLVQVAASVAAPKPKYKGGRHKPGSRKGSWETLMGQYMAAAAAGALRGASPLLAQVFWAGFVARYRGKTTEEAEVLLKAIL